MGKAMAWWRWLRVWRQNQLVEKTDRIAVLEHVGDGGRLGPRYAFMTLLSCGIAMLGLLQDSAAVIIGAMLISPLMGPIIELGLGLATFDLRSVRSALKTLTVGVAIALAIAAGIVWLSPLQAATPEILARTEPTFFDLLVAVFSGLAGAYATITRKGETIVGVAIATALMPPLAVVGYGLAVGNPGVAGGATFLFMTNLLAIALSATIMARWYGFGGSDSPRQTALQAVLIVGTFVLLSIPLGLALQRIALRSQAELAVRTAFDDAVSASAGRVSALRVDAKPERIDVDAVVMVPRHVAGLEAALERTLSARLGRPVGVSVREVLTADDASVARQQGTLAELRRSVAALQVAQEGRVEAQRTQDAERVRALAAVLPYFGELGRSADGRRWQLRLAPGNTMPLLQAMRMEAAINAAPKGRAIAMDIVPALRALPSLSLDDADAADSAAGNGNAVVALSQDTTDQLAAQGWALKRWGADAVDVALTGGDATRRAAVEAVLRAQGLRVAEVRYVAGAPRVRLAPATAAPSDDDAVATTSVH